MALSTPAVNAAEVAESPQSPNSDSVTVGEEVLPNSHIRLTVTVPPAFVRKAYQRAIKKLRAETEVEGFRKGKKVMELPRSPLIFIMPVCTPVQHLNGDTSSLVDTYIDRYPMQW